MPGLDRRRRTGDKPAHPILTPDPRAADQFGIPHVPFDV